MQIDTITQPQKGDLVLIQGTITVDRVEPYRVAEVKETPDGTEIILNKKRNVWFNWGTYMSGKSWVTDCRVVFP
jgi:hypothetical protein